MIVAGGQILQEGVLENVVGGHILEVGRGGHAVFLQQGEDLIQGHTFGDGDFHFFSVAGVAAHGGDEGAVVHFGVELIGAGGDEVTVLLVGALGLHLGVGHPGKELEEQFGLDEPVVLKALGHIRKIIALRHGDGGDLIGLVEGQHIAGGHPGQRGQQRREAQHEDHIKQGRHGAGLLFLAGGGLLGAALGRRRGTGQMRGGIAPPALGPASGVSIEFLWHDKTPNLRYPSGIHRAGS